MYAVHVSCLDVVTSIVASPTKELNYIENLNFYSL